MSNKAKTNLKTPKKTESPPATQTRQHPLLDLRQEVDSLFDNFFSSFSLGPFGRYGAEFDPFRRLGTALTSGRGFMPSADVTETDKEFRVSFELPGMDEGDIELSLRDGQLVVKGEKKEEKKTDDEDRHLMERHYGSIYRSLPLPKGVDEESVEATYEKGVLEVTLKKTETPEKTGKTVKIKTK